MDDQALLERANRGEQTALAAAYDTYHAPIYRYIYRQVGEVETARDLTAVTFQRLLQAIENGQGPARYLRAWLYRTAHNLVVDYYRRRQHRQHLPLNERLIDGQSDPVHAAEQHLAARDVRDAIQQLTPEQQQVIALKFFADMSNAEVAAVLQKPVGAVKSLQHRALAALQRHLTQVREKV